MRSIPATYFWASAVFLYVREPGPADSRALQHKRVHLKTA